MVKRIKYLLRWIWNGEKIPGIHFEVPDISMTVNYMSKDISLTTEKVIDMINKASPWLEVIDKK